LSQLPLAPGNHAPVVAGAAVAVDGSDVTGVTVATAAVEVVDIVDVRVIRAARVAVGAGTLHRVISRHRRPEGLFAPPPALRAQSQYGVRTNARHVLLNGADGFLVR